MGLVPLCAAVSAVGFIIFALLLGAQETGPLTWGMLRLESWGSSSCPERHGGTVEHAWCGCTTCLITRGGTGFRRAWSGCSTCLERGDAIWLREHQIVHGDWKRNAGAAYFRNAPTCPGGLGSSFLIETNARVGFLDLAGTKIYLFPDRLLFFGPGGVQSIRYEDLSVKRAMSVSERRVLYRPTHGSQGRPGVT